ncbi:MAG: rRNA maturation RNase YbeY [Armatimonadota bacterium]
MIVDQKRLEKAVTISLLYEHFNKPSEVSIVLTDDEQMHDLNRDYRGIDKSTDVLSFSQLDEDTIIPDDMPVPIGDIIISTDTAERQASSGGRSLNDELEILVVHGVLHLLGYDDETDETADEMREREKGILTELRNG